MNTQPDRLPIMKLWNLILVPLQGEISDDLVDDIRRHVLETIRDSGADGLVLDLTGVWMMDSHLCSVLTKLAASAKLMGTPSILCGMSAAIALTLQTMGIDLGGVRTALTVEEAFEAFGIRPVRHDHEGEADTDEDEAPANPAEDAPPNQPLRV
ncbi:MAG TPA: STAS domain-containing protein [Polyangiaceae bacterium]|jgi:rsbT antagonist protein RsbS|nr:STAS domain-containing protein [Polyangiaceae bacterium]